MSDFDVLMPVYAGENESFLKEALDSVVSNSLQPDKLVVVCDGPLSAGLYKMLNTFSTYRPLTICQLEENKGITAALNYGLSVCNKKFVIRCDSDDINHPDRFAKLVECLSSGIDVVGSNIQEFDERGNLPTKKEVPLDHVSIKRYAKYRNPMNHMSVAFSRERIKLIGGYPAIYLKEDYALWANLLGAGCKFKNLKAELVSARAGADMVGRRRGLKAAASEIQLQYLLYKNGVSNLIEIIIMFIVRFGMLLLPKKILILVYKKILRVR